MKLRFGPVLRVFICGLQVNPVEERKVDSNTYKIKLKTAETKQQILDTNKLSTNDIISHPTPAPTTHKKTKSSPHPGILALDVVGVPYPRIFVLLIRATGWH